MLRNLLFLLMLICPGLTHGQAPTNLDDLRGWPANRLPIGAVWNAGGFTFDWHVEQVQSGRRLIPTIILKMPDQANKPTLVSGKEGKPGLSQYNPQLKYLSDSGLPIGLRVNSNIGNCFTDSPRWRFPKVAESIANSPLMWRLDPRKGDALNDVPTPDVYGLASNWASEGALWSASLEVQWLVQQLPNPAYVVLWDNNEDAVPNAKDFFNPAVNGQPRQWKTDAELRSISIRAADRHLQPDCPPDFDSYKPEFDRLYAAQYGELFKAFKAGTNPAWSLNFRTGAYSDPGTHFDSNSVACYLGANRTLNSFDDALAVTGDTWVERSKTRPGAHIELFISLEPGGVFQGRDVLTPERFGGLVEQWAWRVRRLNADGASPVVLHYWNLNPTKPTDLFFVGDNADKSQARLTALDAAGYPELTAATHADYIQPVIEVADRIASDAKVRAFWQRGTPVEVASGSPQVLAQGVSLNGQTLLIAFSDSKLDAPVDVTVPGVGAVSVRPQPTSYTVIGAGDKPPSKAIERLRVRIIPDDDGDGETTIEVLEKEPVEP